MTSSTVASSEQQARIDAIAQAAAAWRDPGYTPRAEAVEKTLDAPNRFTEQALAFAINQQMDQLTPDALSDWIGEHWAEAPHAVGVLNAGNVPLAGLRDLLAVLLTGDMYVGALAEESPYLLPAFVDDVRRFHASLPVRFVEAGALFEQVEAVIATGDDDTIQWVREQCASHGIDDERRWLRERRYGVAVIDGRESEDDREDLAVDALLHEGYGCRSVAIIWAPRDLNPDPYLDAFALFRGMFPTHPEMPGTLQMPRAFLEATDQSHAYGEGLEFLVSRGDPEPQQPGHIRWAEYDALDAVNAWLDAHEEEIQLVVARSDVADRLTTDVPVLPLGAAQRLAFDEQPDRDDRLAFLAGLG